MSTTPVITGAVLEASAPTQLVHPWRASLRSVLSALVAFVLLAPLLWWLVQAQAAAQHLIIPPRVEVWAGAVVAACLFLTGLVNRAMLIPAVASFVHRLNLGPTPKLTPQPPVGVLGSTMATTAPVTPPTSSVTPTPATVTPPADPGTPPADPGTPPPDPGWVPAATSPKE